MIIRIALTSVRPIAVMFSSLHGMAYDRGSANMALGNFLLTAKKHGSFQAELVKTVALAKFCSLCCSMDVTYHRLGPSCVHLERLFADRRESIHSAGLHFWNWSSP